MCGIIGLIGDHAVAPLLVEALRRLEYRGYDSAGIATLHGGRLDRRRAVGKLGALSDLLVEDPIRGQTGIGHTRWATHGAPTLANAHPHRSGPVAIVHNGIIENHRQLRDTIGGPFETETDSEIIAVLCARHLAAGLAPEAAARATVAELQGAFALVFLFEGAEMLVAARRGSPLAIGWGDGMSVGSDAIALLGLADRIAYLEEGDIAVVTRSGATVTDADGAPVTRAQTELRIDLGAADKGNHKHFMIKEIYEQPVVLADAIDAVLAPDRSGPAMPDLGLELAAVDRVALIGCGTAHYAALVAKYWIEGLARIPCDVEVASEFRYREPPLSPTTLALFVSQSGETADTLAALRHTKGQVARTVGVVNVTTSTIAREADAVLPIHARPEIAVASTKAFTCQLATLAALALALATAKGLLTPERSAALAGALAGVPGQLNAALGADAVAERLGQALAGARDVLYLGRGAAWPLALEGALKLKELSYIHAEGYPAGELKHGPLALIDDKVPVIVFAPSGPGFDKTLSNIQEVMARGGRVLLVSDAAGIAAAGPCWDTLTLPAVDPFVAPILYAVPAQLLAYHTALAKGTDVDQPRNLAKSVTVE